MVVCVMKRIIAPWNEAGYSIGGFDLPQDGKTDAAYLPVDRTRGPTTWGGD